MRSLMAYAIERRTETTINQTPSKNNEDFSATRDASLCKIEFATRTFATSARMSKDVPESGDPLDWMIG